MSAFVTALREQLVDAAEREQARRLPRVHAPAPRILVAVAATAAMALIVLLAAAALNTRPLEDDEREAAPPAPEGRELFGGEVEPGVRYRTRLFVPALSFEVTGDDWQVGDTTQPDWLILERGEGYFDPPVRRPPAALWFTRVLQVYDPAVRGLAASVAPAPADLHAWMRAHPDLRVGRERPVTVAGVPGDRFDVTVGFRRPTHDVPDCRRRFQVTCTAITPTMAFQDGTLLQVTVLRTEPEPLVVMLEHFTRAGLRDLEEAAAPVLESLRIGIR
jgi:hypothetical protein